MIILLLLSHSRIYITYMHVGPLHKVLKNLNPPTDQPGLLDTYMSAYEYIHIYL